MVCVLFVATEAAPPTGVLEDVVSYASILESVVTTLAIVVGGVWAYFRFGKERPYRPRFRLEILTRLVEVAGLQVLLCRLVLENSGSSMIPLVKDESRLRLRLHEAPRGPKKSLRWAERGTRYSVLQEHAWIESGETIQHDHAIQLPVPTPELLLLEFRVVTRVRRLLWEDKEIAVYTRRIVMPGRPWGMGADTSKELTRGGEDDATR